MGSGTCTYTTNNLNEYTAAGSTSFQYDDSGNLTQDGTYTYDFDPENRLIRVHKSGSPPPPPLTLAQALDLPLVYTTGGRINTRSATRRDVRESIGRLFTCVPLGTLSPDPWDFSLWARDRITG
jgi:hypothetical protein